MIQKMTYRIFISVFAVALALSSWQPAFAQSAQPISASGWFNIVWGDGRPGSSKVVIYTFTDDAGQLSILSLDDALMQPLGGAQALDRHRIQVAGIRQVSVAAEGGQPTIRVDSVSLLNPAEGLEAEGVTAQAVTGSQPFLSIMCKFSDVSTEPKTLTYFKNMYSNVYPGLDSYWREVSYLTANIAGSNALGWYTLPHPRSYYLPGGHLDHASAAADCTAAVDAAVNFAPFRGINLMFNGDLDGYAWGGSQCLTLDGVFKCWPMTWEPPWGYSDITVISHEMGHAFGLAHSSGTYGATYDNQWDVMSDTWSNCSRSTDPTYGCLGQQTNSYHKDKLGWIPTAKKYNVIGNATITLEQLALPQTGNYLMAQIPIAGSKTHFYTIEVRRQTGYDVKLPGQAVIIQDVDTTRERPANVIDADGNGNTGDAGAMWTVGEKFSDAANKIYVTVVSATATGFKVSIQAPAITPPTTSVVFRSVAANDGWILESGENSTVGGAFNSAATTLRLGDDAANRQYRSILHFDTSGLPDTAVITSVTLKIMKQGLVGTNPFTTHGTLQGDIRSLFLGTSASLQAGDFQVASSKPAVLPFGATPTGNWYSAVLSSAALSFVSRTGTTQFRLRFTLDDNNDLGADYMSFYTGNDTTVANRPQLVVKYYVP